MFTLVFVLILLVIAGCSQQQKSLERSYGSGEQEYNKPANSRHNDQRDCNSVNPPTVNVVCKDAGVYTEFNPATGKNEYHKQEYCYAYLSGEQGITYRVIGYQSDGATQDLGETTIGGSIKVGVKKYLSYVEAYPNIDGNFCTTRTTTVYKNQFNSETLPSSQLCSARDAKYSIDYGVTDDGNTKLRVCNKENKEISISFRICRYDLCADGVTSLTVPGGQCNKLGGYVVAPPTKVRVTDVVISQITDCSSD